LAGELSEAGAAPIDVLGLQQRRSGGHIRSGEHTRKNTRKGSQIVRDKSDLLRVPGDTLLRRQHGNDSEDHKYHGDRSGHGG
jgi:hypothetical protein